MMLGGIGPACLAAATDYTHPTHLHPHLHCHRCFAKGRWTEKLAKHDERTHTRIDPHANAMQTERRFVFLSEAIALVGRTPPPYQYPHDLRSHPPLLLHHCRRLMVVHPPPPAGRSNRRHISPACCSNGTPFIQEQNDRVWPHGGWGGVIEQRAPTMRIIKTAFARPKSVRYCNYPSPFKQTDRETLDEPFEHHPFSSVWFNARRHE